jgi:hypothetical protein
VFAALREVTTVVVEDLWTVPSPIVHQLDKSTGKERDANIETENLCRDSITVQLFYFSY